MRRVFGELARPRLLVVMDHGFDDDEDDSCQVRGYFESLAPSVRFATIDDLNRSISHREWDAIVLWQCQATVAEGICVVQFGAERTGVLNRDASPFLGQTHTWEPAAVYSLPEEPFDDVAHLVEALAGDLHEKRIAQVMTIARPDAHELITPFLLNSNGRPVAGVFARRQDDWHEWWWLPAGTPEPGRWVTAAINRWRRSEPSTFETVMRDWTQDLAWQTAEEARISGSLQELRADHELAVVRFQESEAQLALSLEAVSRNVDEGPRRLLTSQGDELKDEVQIALSELGFEVADADREFAEKGDLLEDLRVTDPENPEWIALVEVRGYTGGAKVNDLLRISRFVSRYVGSTGKPPSAAWYVVNQHLQSDPALRSQPLASNPQEVAEFAKGGGLVVHTTDLFKARESVRRGDVSSADVRQALKSVGLFEMPSA